MKKVGLCPALVLLSIVPTVASAADFQGQGTSLFRFEQRATPGFSKQNVVPFTQFVGADLDKLVDGNLSVHLYGWERVDLADRSTGEKSNDGDLSYGYLSYRFSRANAEVKGGRFFVYEGVAAEQIDGVSAKSDLAAGFAVASFAGAPVRLDRGSDTKGSFIAGGRGSYRYGNIWEVGVSGLNERGGTFDPVSQVKSDRQMVGGDLWVAPVRYLELTGHTFYNTATKGVAEESYVLSVKPVKPLTVTLLFNEADLVHYFASSNLRSLFNPDLGGKVRYYGGSATWSVAPPLEVSADYRRINRTESLDPEKNGDSNRYGAEARLSVLEKKGRTGFTYHRIEGVTAGFNSYHEIRGYFLYDSGRYITSFDGIGQIYQDPIFSSREAFELIASTGMRIKPDLALSGEISYGQNPRLADDLRGLVRLTFNYSLEGKGAKK